VKLVRAAIWIATVVFILMLFTPLVKQMRARMLLQTESPTLP
jgi:hypothetical protein